MEVAMAMAVVMAVISLLLITYNASDVKHYKDRISHNHGYNRQRNRQSLAVARRRLRWSLLGLVLSPAAIVVVPLAGAVAVVWYAILVVKWAFEPEPPATETVRSDPEPPKPDNVKTRWPVQIEQLLKPRR
jgi:hypothetical protein